MNSLIVSPAKSLVDDRGETILFGPYPHHIIYTKSKEGVLRGIHFQTENWCEKKIHVLSGTIFDVIVNLKTGSWIGNYLNAPIDIFCPKGYAHGYLALSYLELIYEFIPFWDYTNTQTLVFNDPNLNIPWGDYYTINNIIVSKKDCKGMRLEEIQAKGWTYE